MDDVRTVWFQCEKCGEKTSKPKQKDPEYCEDCGKFKTDRCKNKDDRAPPNKESPACPEYEEAPEPVVLRSKSEDDGGKSSQSDRLVKFCLMKRPVLFHDQHKIPYIRIRQRSALVTMPLRSREFKSYLAMLMWEVEEKVPNTEALNSAINVLKGKALLQGEQITLYNRVAPAEDGVWIDMTDAEWRAIHVTSAGWEIVDYPPIIFKRYSHQLPLPEPEPGGDPWKLLNYFNITSQEEAAAEPPQQDKPDDENSKLNSKLVLMCLFTSYFLPLIPHPILVPYGIQGSAKSCMFRFMRRVFDPSSIELLTMPRDERERIQQLDHHWLAFYDNVSSIPTWISDSLCRAATGGGFTKRELYSDDDDIIYNILRCLGLNGINIAAQRGDLLDRVILLALENIPNDKRKEESELFADFEKDRAGILGGFLDVLAKAMQFYPDTKPSGLFRMADFTRWGCAISKALGKTDKEFLEAYEEKVKGQIEEGAHASPVATVLLDFMQSREEYEGTPTDLFKALISHAKGLEISTRQKSWPRAPHVLSRQLNELVPSLKALGWNVEVSKSGIRRIVITCVPSVPSAQSEKINSDTMLAVKDWARVNKNERSEINLEVLTNFILKELKLSNPQRVIAKAFAESILMPSPKLGMAVVV
jgi:predicted  nucleic acid-binding Zn-ribbon protein